MAEKRVTHLINTVREKFQKWRLLLIHHPKNLSFLIFFLDIDYLSVNPWLEFDISHKFDIPLDRLGTNAIFLPTSTLSF